MESIKGLFSKYWFITIPLAIWGGYMAYQVYVAPKLSPATTA